MFFKKLIFCVKLYCFSSTALCSILIAGGSDIPREVVRVGTVTIVFFARITKAVLLINIIVLKYYYSQITITLNPP